MFQLPSAEAARGSTNVIPGPSVCLSSRHVPAARLAELESGISEMNWKAGSPRSSGAAPYAHPYRLDGRQIRRTSQPAAVTHAALQRIATAACA